MPALSNPRHEAFAQALFAALSDGQGYSQGKAYRAAGYLAKPGASADSAASSRLRKFKAITDRVRELVAEANARNQPKIDLSRERIGKRLDLALRIAEQQGNDAAMATSELGIAKVFGHMNETPDYAPTDFANAKTMTDIGRKLLQSVGFASPDDVSIQAAIEANDAFIAAARGDS